MIQKLTKNGELGELNEDFHLFISLFVRVAPMRYAAPDRRCARRKSVARTRNCMKSP